MAHYRRIERTAKYNHHFCSGICPLTTYSNPTNRGERRTLAAIKRKIKITPKLA